MKPVTFIPDVFSCGKLCLPDYTEEDLKNEPSIYGGSINWTRNNAGPITRTVLAKISKLFGLDKGRTDIIARHALLGYHPVIDTRVTMMINSNFTPVDLVGEDLEMYQAIPGWHCDGVIRSKRGSQPDLSTINEPVYHYIISLSSGDTQIAPTGLVRDTVAMNIDDKSFVWSQVDKHISTHEDELRIIKTQDKELVRFSRSTIHKTYPARARGFRYFFRLSFYHMPAMNEIRVNNNVYLRSKEGW